MKILSRLLFTALCTFGAALHAANLKVNLAPTAAVSAGAQWRVDGGTWRNSGTTASGLSNGSHTVDFKAISGWVTPATQAVTLGGATTTLTGTYVQTAALKITLTPSSGQWRVDSGTWQASAATLTGLTPGSHTVTYASVSGYASPATETVTLTSGQTTSFSRSYTQLAQLKITLSPATAQWRVDGGAWRASGVTVSSLAPGSHTVDYAALSGYAAPASESVTLSSGQLLTLNRSYVQLAQLSVTLTPASAQWRVDGGAWLASGTTASNLSVGSHTVDYNAVGGYIAPGSESVSLASGQSLSINRSYVQLAQVSVALTPASGQWRVDGGTWLASGATLSNLTPGTHSIGYASLINWASPADETITLSPGQALNLSRSYTQLAQISIALVPSSGQWRANGGAWQASGASLMVVPGNYTVEYSTLPLYDSPASDTFTLDAGGVFAGTRYYVSQKPSVRVNLNAGGQWRIDGGAWQNSGAQLSELDAGNHTLDYSDVGGDYAPLPSETITLALHENLTLTRAYPFKTASLTLTLVPGNAQWRLVGSITTPWQSSGATVTGVPAGANYIEYGGTADYYTPATETITFTPGQVASLSRSYAPKPGQVQVITLAIGSQWRMYPEGNAPGGVWYQSGDISASVSVGNYVVEYNAVPNYTAPPSEIVTVLPNQTVTFNRPYSANPGQLTVNLSPVTGQWRVDGGAWQASGATLANLAAGSHTVEYGAVAEYTTLPAEPITISAGQSVTITRSYTYANPASVSVTLNPSYASWRLDGGLWQSSSTQVSYLLPGPHTIDYSNISGYVALPSETVTLVGGTTLSLSRSYTESATFSVSLNPTYAQWRLDGGAWQNSGTYLYDFALGDHNVEFSAVPGYITPAPTTVTLTSGYNSSIYRSYTELASFSVSLNPTYAQWRLDGGAWQNSGTYLYDLALGDHNVEFSAVPGYITPAPTTVTLTSGYNSSIYRSYTELASFSVSLNPTYAQWRLDGGAWQNSGTYLYDLALGDHNVEFSTVPGYITPAPTTVTLTSGYNSSIYRSYTELASFSVSLNPTYAQWRLDGGAWQNSGTYLYDLALGDHNVEFSTVPGYVTPAPTTVTLTSGFNSSIYRSYTELASFSVSLNPTYAQWRLDGGAWQNSGSYLYQLALGDHTVEFSEVPGYVTPAPTTVTLTSGFNSSIYRSYTELASFSVSLNPTYAQWRLDGGAWQNSGSYLYQLALGDHTVEFSEVPGYIAPPIETVTLTSGYNPSLTRTYSALTPHRLRFFLNQDIAGSMPLAEVQRRIGLYAAQINAIFSRETQRSFTFDPNNDITLCTADPFSGSYPGTLPQTGFEVWIYAKLTDDPVAGSQGGASATDVSGAGGVHDLKWDQIYDPGVLADGSAAAEQYWRQINATLRSLEQMFGGAAAGYDSLGGMKDASGVAPIAPDTAAGNSALPDSFWIGRAEYWGDPLTANAWANPRIGSPTSVATLLNVVSFAPVSEGLINRAFRGADKQAASLPDLSSVVVKVVDAQTGAPISGSNVRVWNRSRPTPPFDTYEETVTTGGAAATFTFTWSGSPLETSDNAKLLKAYAPGYAPSAQWVTSYDAQKAKVIDHKTSLEITIGLTPQ